jgi:hypothetical protein
VAGIVRSVWEGRLKFFQNISAVLKNLDSGKSSKIFADRVLYMADALEKNYTRVFIIIF